MAPRPKFTFAELAVLDWLCEKGRGRRIRTHSSPGPGDNFVSHYERLDAPDASGRVFRHLEHDRSAAEALRARLGGSLTDRATKLHAEKLLFRVNAEKLGLDLHWAEGAYAPTNEGYLYWQQEGAALLEEMRAERRREEERVERWVIVRSQFEIRPELPSGRHFTLPSRTFPGAAGFGKVVKESEKRLYLADFETSPLVGFLGVREIQRSRHGLAIDREHVLLDPATRADFEHLKAFDQEHAEEVRGILAKAVSEIQPIIDRMESRFAQKEVARDEMLREILEGKAGGPKAP